MFWQSNYHRGTAVKISHQAFTHIIVESAEKGQRGEGKEDIKGRTVRGDGGSPHFCSDFALPPSLLRFIPFNPCRQSDKYQTAHPVEQSVLNIHPAGSSIGHNRLPRRQ